MYQSNSGALRRMGSYGAALILLFAFSNAFGQAEATKKLFHMNVAIGASTSLGGASWRTTVAVIGSPGFVIDSVQAGDILFDENGNKFVVDDDSLLVSGYSVRLDLTNLDGTGRPLSGRGALMRPSTNLALNLMPQNGNNYISENAESKLLVDNFLRIDSLLFNFSLDTAYFSNDSLFLIFPGGDTLAVLIDINLDFDSNRDILRTPSVGTNIGGTTIHQWLEWWYFVAPTISVSSMTSPVEVGTSTTYNISGSTTNPGSATLSAGYFRQTAPSTDTLVSFGSATSYADTVVFTPQQGGVGQFNELTYTFQAKQNWVFGSESGTATASRTITAVYPVLYGMSATDFTVTGDPYTLTKLVQAEGNKTVTLTGSGFIYYLIPKTWSDFTLSQIIDHNGFNVTPSFTSYDVTVSSSGLVNDWSAVPYKLYKLNTTTTTSGYAYQFIR